MKRKNFGNGFVYQPKFKDRQTGEIKTSPTWWISLSHHGQRIRMSSHSERRPDAVRLLGKKLGELGAGKLIGRSVDNTTFEDLAQW
jgi:hypothetical protein